MKKGIYVCEACHRKNEFEVTEYINAAEDLVLKEKLIQGKLFTQHCSSCGHENIVVSSMLYEDAERHFFLEMIPQGDRKEGERLEKTCLSPSVRESAGMYRKRVVHEPNDLLEKIAVFEEGLDDRVVEIMKLSAAVSVLHQQNITISDLYFSPSEKGREFDVLVKHEFYGTLPFQQNLYDEIRDSIIPQLNPHEASATLIDMDWALEVIRSGKGRKA